MNGDIDQCHSSLLYSRCDDRPRHRFPTAAVDVRSGWDWLCTEKGFAPDRIVIAGDSAGGHLAVDLMLQRDVDHPAGLALLSPLIDLTFGLARTPREELRRDPAIRAIDAAKIVGLYCAGMDLTYPRLTLDVAGGRRMPATPVQSGGGETPSPRYTATSTPRSSATRTPNWP